MSGKEGAGISFSEFIPAARRTRNVLTDINRYNIRGITYGSKEEKNYCRSKKRGKAAGARVAPAEIDTLLFGVGIFTVYRFYQG